MIYTTATYTVKQEGIEAVKKAIEEFTQYVKENEPGTLMYVAWQKKEDPQTFIHFFIFKDQQAQDIHSKSKEVKQFESVYSPVLVSEGVEFIDFNEIATNLSFLSK